MAIQQTRQAREPETSQQPAVKISPQQRERQYQYSDVHRRLESKGEGGEGLATFLGWFSIGLGLAEVIAPRSFARLIGSEGERAGFIRFACGVREIAAGIGILTNKKPAGWLWARVAGDGLDLAALGTALASEDTDKGRLLLATASVIGVTALDIKCAQQLSSGSGGRSVAMHSITINRPPDELYKFWRNFENLPRFMDNLESVRVTGEGRSHWVAKGPMNTPVEWDAETLEDRPNELISWRSVEGSEVENSGTVRFVPAPRGRGTEIHVEIAYNPPAGFLGAGVAKLFGAAPEQLVKGDLYRFKQLMETGEVVRSDASIHPGMHPAQPPEELPAEIATQSTAGISRP